ncbi:MAG TPA: hypothetical protein VKO38_03375 [Wenzhouxiangella sp.]|nr:hypothetical protein [Wenzhouxiangella sp.]
MLPVVRNRSFHVPHGLAALAAAVCLILAFSTEDSRPLVADNAAEPQPSPAMVTVKQQHETPSRQVKPLSEHHSASQHVPTVWIPWFPGRKPAG